MKTQSLISKLIAPLFGLIAITAAIIAVPSGVQAAATSAGATIWNKVTVTYTASGVVDVQNSAVETVTVVTKAAEPTVTVTSAAQTTLAGGEVVYTYTILSNANGPDTYAVAADGVTADNTSVNPETNSLSTNSIDLWSGIVTGSGAGYVELPGGFDQTFLDDGNISLLVGGTRRYYTVTAASTVPGSVNAATGVEIKGRVYLTPLSGSDPAITAGNVAAGDVISEYDTFTNTLTAGALTAPPADGTHLTNLTFTCTATDENNAAVAYTTKAGDNNETTTTVKDQVLTITKIANPISAKPGQIITYTITVENVSTNEATGVSINDAVPTYTTYVGSSTRLNAKTVAGDGAASPLAAGLIIDDDATVRAPGAVALGTIQGGGTATIVYEVTVD